MSIFSQEAIARSSGTLTQVRGLRRLVPAISLNDVGSANFARLRDCLLESAEVPRVLVIGGGEGGEGFSRLGATGPAIEIVVSDVAISPATDLCLDAHAIPFADASFDAVVVQAVLEHVLDPGACVLEIARVLKPGGLVYAETPFMQQVHMGAFDFTRFTLLGHRRLFRSFDEIDSGVAVGPGSALAWSLVYFFVSFSRTVRGRRILNIGSRFAFFWLKYFDRLVRNNPSSSDGAAGVYFLGSKSENILEDQRLIQGYSGGMNIPTSR